jgi:DNA replication and repair protein RecF
MIEGKYQRLDSEENIYCGLKQGQKKIVRRNKKVYKKLSEHIGLLPVIVVTPSDNDLISGGSEERRRFIDSVISQYNAVYLEQLIRYNRALLQRNNLLKQFATTTRPSRHLNGGTMSRLPIHQGGLIHCSISANLSNIMNYFRRREKVGLKHFRIFIPTIFKNLKDSIARDRHLQYIRGTTR